MAPATFTLRATYNKPNGEPQIQSRPVHIYVTGTKQVKDTAGNVIISGRVEADVVDGVLTVPGLPDPRDPGYNPDNFGLTVSAVFRDNHPPAVSFGAEALDAHLTNGVLELEDVTPVDPSTFAPTTTYAEKSELDAVAATIPTTAADVGALPDTTQIPSTAADVGAEPAGLSQTTNDTLATTYAPRRNQAIATRAAGVLCISWDDGFPMWDDVRTLANTLGQRHTFAVQSGKIDQTGGITSAFVAQAHADGHEISSHSVTHAKITTLGTQAERLAEYDNSRTAIEAIIGAGECRTWTYPYGTANAPAGRDITTDRELYLRYDRLLDTNGGEDGVMPLGGLPRFVIPRVDWNPGDPRKHARALELVRRARWQPVIVNLYSHDPSVGWTQVQELMQLAADLGIPCVRSDEAHPPVPVGLMDPGFETDTVFATPTGDGTWAHAVKTPPAGLPGSKSLAVTSTGTTGSRYVSIDYPIHPLAVGLEHTLSLWIANNQIAAGAAPKVYGRIRFYGADYAQVGATTYTPSTNLAAWTRVTGVGTPPAGTVIAKLDLIQEQQQATSYFEHLHFGPTAFGVYG